MILSLVAFGLALVGCVISAVLVWMSLNTESDAALYGTKLCAPTETVDCASVLRTRFARIGPMPAANLGFVYFVFFAIWNLFVGAPNHAGRKWHLLPLLVALVGAAFSAWFVYVMAAVLPVWCTWCVAAHVVNLLLLIITFWMWPRGAAGDAARRFVPPYPSNLRAGLVLGATGSAAIIAFLVAFAAFLQFGSQRMMRDYLAVVNNAEYVLWRYEQSRAYAIPVGADDTPFGAADAKHTLVLFGDFECPHCRDAFRNGEGLTRMFPKDLRFVVRHFPATSACNPYMPQRGHRYACDAARAAEAARATGDANQYHAYLRLLFENPDRFAERPWEGFAKQANIDIERFRSAMAAPAAAERIAADVELGHRVQVIGSGELYLDGRKLPSNWKIIDPSTRKIDREATFKLWESLLGAKAEGKHED